MCAVNDESGSLQLDFMLSILAVNTMLQQCFILGGGRRSKVACAPQNKRPSQHTVPLDADWQAFERQYVVLLL